MKIKKLRFVCKGYDTYQEIEQLLIRDGVAIAKRLCDVNRDVYTFHVNANRDQALRMLSYAQACDGLLLKGEEE